MIIIKKIIKFFSFFVYWYYSLIALFIIHKILRIIFEAATQFASPNEYLISKDDVLDEVWYISSGSLEVLDQGIVVAILG